MEQTLRAIVLRRRDAGESDRRLTVLSEERGLVDVFAKGARKAGSRLAGCSEPLAVSVMQVAKGKQREFLTQAQPITSFPGLRDDYDRLACGLSLAEVAAQTTPHERPEPELFTFLLVALKHVETHEKPLVALVWALAGLLDVTGHRPSFDLCAETGAKIAEANPWYSSAAGGYVRESAASSFSDRTRTRPEVLIGLARLLDCEEPPPNLKFAEECLGLLQRIWTDIAGRDLATLDQMLKSLHIAANGG